MKIWAKVRFGDSQEASNLIRAFFRDFNPENSIEVRDEGAKVEIIFDKEIPMQLIDAISLCTGKELDYGKKSGEDSEVETEQVAAQEVLDDAIQEQAEEVVDEQSISEQAEQVVEKKKGRTARTVDEENIDVPELEEIAGKAVSFQHFVKLVAEWLEMTKKQEVFEKLVIAACEVKKVSWKEVGKALENKGVSYSQWDKIWISRQVTAKLETYSVTVIPFLNLMRQYKDYPFKPEQAEEEITTAQESEEMVGSVEEVHSELEAISHTKRRRMECMPEIPYFEEVLGSVDKTLPIEERVMYILTAMGLDKKAPMEQQEIFEITNSAVRIRNMTYDIIIVNANIPMGSAINARMTFSQFLNEFVGQYDSEKKVKMLDFLKQLQEIIVYEYEIKSFDADDDCM